MAEPTWLILGDEHIQEMYRHLVPLLRGTVKGDVIGSKDSTYSSWNYGGTPGAVQGQSRSGFQIYVQEVQPDVSVIVLGSNPEGSLPANFDLDVQTAVAETGRYSGHVVLVGPFANDPQGKRLAAMRRVVPDAIDGYTLAEGLPRDADGIHFTRDGYQELTNRMVAAVFHVLDRRMPKPPLTIIVARPSAEQQQQEAVAAAAAAAAGQPAPEAGTTDVTTKTEPTKSRWPWIVGGIAVLGVVGAVLYYSRRR